LNGITIRPITSCKPGRVIYPNEVLLSPEESGLEMESVVMAHQIRTIARHRIKRRAGRLTSPDLREACLEAIQIHLGMY
jgi:mRNA interferase MazF